MSISRRFSTPVIESGSSCEENLSFIRLTDVEESPQPVTPSCSLLSVALGAVRWCVKSIYRLLPFTHWRASSPRPPCLTDDIALRAAASESCEVLCEASPMGSLERKVICEILRATEMSVDEQHEQPLPIPPMKAISEAEGAACAGS